MTRKPKQAEKINVATAKAKPPVSVSKSNPNGNKQDYADVRKTSDWRNQFKSGALVAIVTALLTSTVWVSQYKIGKQDQLEQEKIRLFRAVSEEGLRAIYLRAFKIHTMVEQYVRIPMNYEDDPIRYNLEAVDEVRKKYPFESEKALEAEAFSPKLKATLVMVSLVFSEKVGSYANDFSSAFTNEAIQSGIDAVLETMPESDCRIENLKPHMVQEPMIAQLEDQHSILLSAMYREIEE
jgi:hypothetical protein